MVTITPYPSNTDYRRFLLKGYSIEEQATLFMAETIATQQHDGQKRRDGTDIIRHPRAVAMAVRDLGLSAVDLATAWLHDTPEDGRGRLSPRQIGFLFIDPVAGSRIAFNLDALTHRIGEDVVSYYRRIAVATAEYWPIIVIKGADRWHFHVCPYGGEPEREYAKALETLGLFSDMCLVCQQYIPTDFLPTYADLVGEVRRLAFTRLKQLESAIPRVLL